jgi:hypothetical protein
MSEHHHTSAATEQPRGMEPILNSLMQATLDVTTTSRPALRKRFEEILRGQVRDAAQAASLPLAPEEIARCIDPRAWNDIHVMRRDIRQREALEKANAILARAAQPPAAPVETLDALVEKITPENRHQEVGLECLSAENDVPVAYRVMCTNNGATGYLYTEQLPFEPGPGVKVRRDPEPLYAALLPRGCCNRCRNPKDCELGCKLACNCGGDLGQPASEHDISCPAALPRSGDVDQASARALVLENANLRGQIEEITVLFDLQAEADRRAVSAWKKAHPDKFLTSPDRCDMVVWLMEEFAKVRAELDQVRALPQEVVKP